MPFNGQMGEVPQSHVLFKIFCIYNYIPLFHSLCLKSFIYIKGCVKFNCTQNYHKSSLIFLTNILIIFPELTNYLQTSPRRVYFFLVLAKWNIHHTASDKYLFLHKAPSVKSTPHSPPYVIKKMLLKKNQFSNFSGSIYWHLYVTLFYFSVRWSSEMQFGMINLETCGGTKTYVAFSTLEFHSCFFVLGGTHMALNSLTFNKPVSVGSCVKSF
jgi:hypothetical protein